MISQNCKFQIVTTILHYIYCVSHILFHLITFVFSPPFCDFFNHLHKTPDVYSGVLPQDSSGRVLFHYANTNQGFNFTVPYEHEGSVSSDIFVKKSMKDEPNPKQLAIVCPYPKCRDKQWKFVFPIKLFNHVMSNHIEPTEHLSGMNFFVNSNWSKIKTGNQSVDGPDGKKISINFGNNRKALLQHFRCMHCNEFGIWQEEMAQPTAYEAYMNSKQGAVVGNTNLEQFDDSDLGMRPM